MPMLSLGDMAHSFMLRRHNVQLSSSLAQLTQELASGQVADLPNHLKGNYSYLGDIERNFRVLDGFDTATNEAALFTDAMQLALEKVQNSSSDLSTTLLTVASSNSPDAKLNASTKAKGELAATISALNSSIAGRSLFAGVSTDATALADADIFLTELQGAVSGETTMSGILSAVDDWFDLPGGGFETLGYLGSSTNMSAFQLGEGEAIDLSLRADDAAIRAHLKHTAIAALAADPVQGYSGDLQTSLILSAGQGLLTVQDDLTNIRADLGYAQARIEESSTRISTEQTSLEYAKGALLAADPYETATSLEAVQFQLESLYAATIQLSKLSLVEYMR